MTEAATRENGGATMWRYRRAFRIDGFEFVVTLRSRTDGLRSELTMVGVPVASDRTPIGGPEAVRNHQLSCRLPDGRLLKVTAGWISALNTAVAVSLDGKLVHESHPGRTIAYPDRYRAQAVAMNAATLGEAIKSGYTEGKGGPVDPAIDPGAWKRNRVPIAVDIALGLLFFAVAKLTDLPTAAIVGAAAGIAIVVLQRFVKVDLIGGLALFGIVMLLISAGLALAFQDDMAVKMRSTIVGTISATLFLGDGLFGGKWLGRGMARYLPYTDIDPGRLAIGMGVLGLVMAGLNTIVALLASTDAWLFYTTFIDLPLVFLMVFAVFRYARESRVPTATARPL